jgi:outer membrane protein insertion porin family
LQYRYERAKVSDVSDDAAQIIQDQEGRSTTSSVTAGFRWDSTDKFFLPTKGQIYSASVEHAGSPFGGSNSFTKYLLSGAWYFPLLWGTVGMVEGRIGSVVENAKDGLPLFEKFYLGGIDSLRGFERYGVSPLDPATGDQIGGNSMWMGTIELRFPIVKGAGLYGAVFYDTGNVYPDSWDWDYNNLRADAGLGLRWFSPMGPLQIDWGVNLDREPDEDASVFDFSVGGTFD